ncbi:MAG: methylated-DNA--[protein]-cysteine S-methyltransferase [Planctomycetes bacterium]|nr:methylated-DNA--[protein]-cysteine S-methyltransferase [Planctomycetota bacterium]MBM4066226.1 methylated-DNA--[protein]-cysteine S-methyltransferase [Planctomycetota bacterium]
MNIQRNDSLLKYEIDLLKAYFQGKQVDFDFPLDLSSGTPFQIMVWNKLREIPYGKCRSYKWVAEQIKNPRAARAVGMANNKNPLPPVIPCHRVIGSDGSLTGYASGLHIKKYLLEMEQRISNGDSPQNTRNKRK